MLLGDGNGCGTCNLLLAGNSQIFRLQRFIGCGHIVIARVFAADQGFPGCNCRLQCVPVCRSTIFLRRQLFAFFDHVVELNKHLEHAVFISNLIHQLVVAGIPVVCCDDRLVIDAQAVCLHGVQETVQQSFRQIADQHELRTVVLPSIGCLGGLIAVKPR